MMWIRSPACGIVGGTYHRCRAAIIYIRYMYNIMTVLVAVRIDVETDGSVEFLRVLL